MTLIEAAKLAREALGDALNRPMWNRPKMENAITSLDQAIAEAEPEQEPFGYFRYDLRLDAWVQNRAGLTGTPLYTAPPKREPLTDEQLTSIITTMCNTDDGTCDTKAFARAVEALVRQVLRDLAPAPEQEPVSDSDCKEADGCPTEKAVLQRFWRAAQQQEIVAWMYTLEYGNSIADIKVSLNQLNYPFGVCGADYLAKNEDGVSYVRQTPLYTAPAAKQEPVAEHELKDIRCECCGYLTYHREHMGCIRAAQPRREWQGLTDEEKESFWRADQMTHDEWQQLFAEIETKLKQKNHD